MAYDESALALPYKPASVRDFVTFESHVEGVRRSIDHAVGVPEAWYDNPTFYFTNPHALYGPGQPVPRPLSCRALDFELEVGVVLGRRGLVAVRGRGDGTRSSATRSSTTGRPATSSPARCRSAWARPRARTSPPRSDRGSSPPTSSRATTTPTASSTSTAACRSTASEVGHDRLSHMHWTFPQMIAYASRDSLVLAGDLLASGTTGGGGCLAELWGRNGSRDPAAAGARRHRRHRGGGHRPAGGEGRLTSAPLVGAEVDAADRTAACLPGRVDVLPARPATAAAPGPRGRSRASRPEPEVVGGRVREAAAAPPGGWRGRPDAGEVGEVARSDEQVVAEVGAAALGESDEGARGRRFTKVLLTTQSVRESWVNPSAPYETRVEFSEFGPG